MAGGGRWTWLWNKNTTPIRERLHNWWTRSRRFKLTIDGQVKDFNLLRNVLYDCINKMAKKVRQYYYDNDASMLDLEESHHEESKLYDKFQNTDEWNEYKSTLKHYFKSIIFKNMDNRQTEIMHHINNNTYDVHYNGIKNDVIYLFTINDFRYEEWRDMVLDVVNKCEDYKKYLKKIQRAESTYFKPKDKYYYNQSSTINRDDFQNKKSDMLQNWSELVKQQDRVFNNPTTKNSHPPPTQMVSRRKRKVADLTTPSSSSTSEEEINKTIQEIIRSRTLL